MDKSSCSRPTAPAALLLFSTTRDSWFATKDNAALARGTSEITAAPSAVTLGTALDSRLELIISPQLPQEMAMVLARPRLWKHLSPEEALQFVTDLAGQTTLMADPPGPQPAVSRVPTTTTSSPLATPTGADAHGHRRSRLALSDTIDSA